MEALNYAQNQAHGLQECLNDPELTPRLWKEKFADTPIRSDLYQRNHGLL